MVEKFLYELVNVNNGTVHTSMPMTERSAEESNAWLRRQGKNHLEWRKVVPKQIDDMTKEK